MLNLLGSDGKEYGPISEDQLRQWIREGRAGGSTQIRRDNERGWTLLRSAPEFADVFQAPPTLTSGRTAALPPVVQLFAYGTFIVAGISGLFLLYNVFIVLRFASNDSFHPGPLYFVSWTVGLLSLPVRIVSGIGLLRGREWARKLAVIFAAVMALYGGWGIVRTIGWVTATNDVLMIFRSPSFLLPQLWSATVLLFNLATVIVLSRRSVRAAFATEVR